MSFSNFACAAPTCCYTEFAWTLWRARSYFSAWSCAGPPAAPPRRTAAPLVDPEHHAPARLDQRGGALEQGACRREAVDAAHQRLAWLEQPHRRVEGGILRLRQIGRIGNDGTIALTCERAKQITLAHLDRPRRLREGHVLAREGRGLGRPFNRDDSVEMTLDSE